MVGNLHVFVSKLHLNEGRSRLSLVTLPVMCADLSCKIAISCFVLVVLEYEVTYRKNNVKAGDFHGSKDLP